MNEMREIKDRINETIDRLEAMDPEGDLIFDLQDLMRARGLPGIVETHLVNQVEDLIRHGVHPNDIIQYVIGGIDDHR